MADDLEGQASVFTDGGRGIGRGISQALAAAGAVVECDRMEALLAGTPRR